MAVYNTNVCTLSVDGTTLANLIDATVELSIETIDVTEIGNLDRKYISGNIYYDQNNAEIAALEAAAKSGAEVAFVFTLHTNATYTANAIITSFSPSIAVADVVRAAFSAQITGEVSISA